MFALDDDMVMFAGDWHGSYDQAARACMAASYKHVRTIIQLGDFGMWPGRSGQTFLNRLNELLVRKGQQVVFVDGNHEDFPQLYSYPVDKDGLRYVRSNIIHLERGTVFSWKSLNLLAMGGAYSVDKDDRVVGATYWLEEQITDADVKKALKAADDAKIDVLVSHDSPASAPNRITDTPEIQREAAQFFGYHNIQQSYLHREQLDKVFKAVKPTLVIHGHYHDFFNYDTKYGKVVCLDDGRSTLKRHIMFLTPEDIASWKRS